MKKCFECRVTESTISTFWKCSVCGWVVCSACAKGTSVRPKGSEPYLEPEE